MPNCQWFGTAEDHETILEFLFETKECEIYESYSQIGEPLKRFSSPSEVLAEYSNTYSDGTPWDTILLELRVTRASPALRPQKIALTGGAFPKGSVRYCLEESGLIALHLATNIDGRLSSSYTNHTTLKRATAYANSMGLANDFAKWDFKEITRFSSKLNRFIRKHGVAKIGSKVVWPNAFDCWTNGAVFDRRYSVQTDPTALVVL